MPPEADRLFHENVSKNLVESVHIRCISILADLWHAPSAKNAVGTATTGSSEAIQLCGLAMKKMWQEKCKAAGKSIHEPGPNIVMGANAQVALEKFARYFEVECRLVPVSVESHYRLDSSKVMEYVDENTIGVFVILGSTYTGHYEPVKEISDLLDEYEAKTGHYVPIHGWVIWRDKAHLPKELIFELHYLGSVEYSFSLNFSRPAAPIITQYFNLINLGFEGYRTVALNDLKNARLLSRALEGGKYYTVLSDIHRKIAGPLEISNGISEDDPEVRSLPSFTICLTHGNCKLYHLGLPVVSFRFSDEFKENYPEVQQRWIQTLLRAKGWIVPNYELPPALEQVEILRVVVKENMTQVLVDQFVADLLEVTESLAHAGTPLHSLNMLDQVRHKRSKPEHHAGALEGGSSEKSSGTYARPCRRKWASTPLREFPRDALHHE
ncbi:hypothetical protein C0989_007792 [Termitomyces sp. Mn162]|nr:hypothetical protein C0989_007792 [Termitomyces sp. Mn162]